MAVKPSECYRERECLDCKQKWSSGVRIADTATHNLSGEATEYCIRCGSRNVMSGPAKRWLTFGDWVDYMSGACTEAEIERRRRVDRFDM